MTSESFSGTIPHAFWPLPNTFSCPDFLLQVSSTSWLSQKNGTSQVTKWPEFQQDTCSPSAGTRRPLAQWEAMRPLISYVCSGYVEGWQHCCPTFPLNSPAPGLEMETTVQGEARGIQSCVPVHSRGRTLRAMLSPPPSWNAIIRSQSSLALCASRPFLGAKKAMGSGWTWEIRGGKMGTLVWSARLG